MTDNEKVLIELEKKLDGKQHISQVEFMITCLLEVCRDQESQLKDLQRQLDRIKPEARYDW